MTAESFISSFPLGTFRSLELAVGVPLVLRELYLPDTPMATSQRSIPANFPFDRGNNPWARLCAVLAGCGSGGLGKLNLWFDIRHLDGWTGRMWEREFFADMWGVEVRGGKGEFLLALPELDGREVERRREREGVGEESYLVGEVLEGAPFRVVRCARPDYWEAHLARIRARQDVLTIDPPVHGS